MAAMRTLLSQFCSEFDQIVRPLLAPLGRAADALGRAPQDLPVRVLRPELIDLRHQIEMLVDKVADQQAFVLIFGPLKSGKSTLMNALCGTYVSEVSSLPAYPCMVFVSDASRREFTVTDYKGDTVVFADPAALRAHIDAAHASLAARIRKVEEAGEQFDPGVHFPEAIRKVDVRLPAGDLAQSGAVLVDTPGLYSRMKFGYDRMTRDFRNAAACAIFVVKSDNLFLEQVFEEFNQLLELFSRIFLVVNLDVTKQDLDPQGNLVPSLEQQDPARLIKAFESLAMSAPLKNAADEGRLRIYPVGLLQAASQRLRGQSGEGGFDEFRSDLTDYLNSTDYLVAFLGDSLRRAASLLEETTQLGAHATVQALEQSLQDLERRRATVESTRDAVQKLAARNWATDLKTVRDELAVEVHKRAQEFARGTADATEGALDRWFRADASLQDLVKEDITPLLTVFQEQLTLAAAELLKGRAARGHAGLEVEATDVEAAARAAIDFTAIGREAAASLARAELVVVPPTPLRSEHVPVRRRLADWLLLRSAAKVRRCVFGPPDRPALRIAVDAKRLRLGEPARAAIAERLARYRQSFCKETLDRVTGDLLGGYVRAVHRTLRELLTARKTELDQQQAEIAARGKLCRNVLGPVRELRTTAGTVEAAVDELASRYGRTDPVELMKPVSADYTLPTPPRAREAGAGTGAGAKGAGA
jgi:GTPase SAR1 family protein